MSCQFDRDLIALHAGGDLPAAEAGLVDRHLAECAACRALLNEYRSGISLVAGVAAVSDVRCPRVELATRVSVVAVRRWAGVAVLVLVAMAAAVAFTEAPALAEFVRKTFDFGPIRVRELTTEEAQQYQQQEQKNWDSRPHDYTYDENGVAKDASGKVISIRSTRVTILEALAALDYHVFQPQYLPEGYAPEAAHIMLNDPKSDIVLTYQHSSGQIVLHQFGPNRTITVDERLPEGASETVTVSGSPALLVRGAWVIEQNGEFHWRSDSPLRLTFTKDGQVIVIEHAYANFPVAELIKVADSLE